MHKLFVIWCKNMENEKTVKRFEGFSWVKSHDMLVFSPQCERGLKKMFEDIKKLAKKKED